MSGRWNYHRSASSIKLIGQNSLCDVKLILHMRSSLSLFRSTLSRFAVVGTNFAGGANLVLFLLSFAYVYRSRNIQLNRIGQQIVRLFVLFIVVSFVGHMDSFALSCNRKGLPKMSYILHSHTSPPKLSRQKKIRVSCERAKIGFDFDILRDNISIANICCCTQISICLSC